MNVCSRMVRRVEVHAAPPRDAGSKIELGGDLDQAGGVGAHDFAERWATYVAIDGGGSVKLGMIGGVEGFRRNWNHFDSVR